MVNLYANRIIADAKEGKDNPFTIDNVPHLWNENTLKELERRGYDGFGKPIEVTE